MGLLSPVARAGLQATTHGCTARNRSVPLGQNSPSEFNQSLGMTRENSQCLLSSRTACPLPNLRPRRPLRPPASPCARACPCPCGSVRVGPCGSVSVHPRIVPHPLLAAFPDTRTVLDSRPHQRDPIVLFWTVSAPTYRVRLPESTTSASSLRFSIFAPPLRRHPVTDRASAFLSIRICGFLACMKSQP